LIPRMLRPRRSPPLDSAHVDATIVGGSPPYLSVVDRAGRHRIIARRTIDEIDHPGAVAEVVGALVAVAGLLLLTPTEASEAASPS
jgi:hypothetical protein